MSNVPANDRDLLIELKVTITHLSEQVSDLKTTVSAMADTQSKYMTRVEYDRDIALVKKIVFGLVGLILFAVASGLIGLVVNKSNASSAQIKTPVNTFLTSK